MNVANAWARKRLRTQDVPAIWVCLMFVAAVAGWTLAYLLGSAARQLLSAAIAPTAASVVLHLLEAILVAAAIAAGLKTRYASASWLTLAVTGFVGAAGPFVLAYPIQYGSAWLLRAIESRGFDVPAALFPIIASAAISLATAYVFVRLAPSRRRRATR